MLATDSSLSARPRAPRRSGARGASATALLGGMTLLVAGLGLGLFLASGRAAPQAAYEPPVIPGRARPARNRPASKPIASGTPKAEPAAPAASGGAERTPPTAKSTTSPAPFARRPFRPGEVGIVVAGPGAADAAQTGRILDARAPDASPLVLADPDPDSPLGDARAVVVLEAGAIGVRSVAPPPLDSDPIAALVPPASLVGDALVGVRLAVGDAERGRAVRAFALLAAGQPRKALDELAPSISVEQATGREPVKPEPPSVAFRVLRGYAHLLVNDLPRVHEEVLGLGADPDVGPVARFLTGAALLADSNPREALRDFKAALDVRPGYWPARLLLGAANDRLALPEAAKDAYAAVLAAAPGRPEAVVGYAPHLAASDRPAAVALVEALLAERPTLVSGWWQLAWLRRTGNTSEDLRREVEAMEHVTALRPNDADAWGALGGARSRWATSGGGVAAQQAASDAFARQCALAPEDGLAWFNRAATLHQVALETPLSGDATAFAPRVAEAREAYAKALARGLSKSDAARVHFNLGLLADALLPVPPAPGTSPAMPGSKRHYADALEADPGYAEAGLALAAARIGERDVKAAAAALAALPPGVDPREKAILEAALAHVKGDPASATRLLTGPAKTPVVGSDALPTLARELLLLGYRRLVVSLLPADGLGAALLGLRARAYAGLCDVAGARADLRALAALDAAKASDLERNDPDVLRTLGAPK